MSKNESKESRSNRKQRERDRRLTENYEKQGLKVKKLLIPLHLWDHYIALAAKDVEDHRKKLKNKNYRKKLGLEDQ